ncbi:hypothetical protein [Dactylosporangium sp. CA-233914]|uniref:hypothetical protein n=1 Tax=Dactylosporangium sp. CA-233914 TaxID=3239934 RepID=UPI003D8E865E
MMFTSRMSGVRTGTRGASSPLSNVSTVACAPAVSRAFRRAGIEHSGRNVHMLPPRFIFLAMVASGDDESVADRQQTTAWMLCSPNNRILGRGERAFDTEAQCRDAVLEVVAGADRLHAVSTALGTSGHWVWRVELDGVPVAVSHRSYLRARESQYNVGRFLAAVPSALVTGGRRVLREASRDRRVA